MDVIVTVKGGRLATPEELHGPIGEAVGLGSNEAQRIFHDNTPIGETGLLHDSWVVQPGEWSSFSFKENVVNTAQHKGYYYARRVNLTSKKNAGYIEKMISTANVEAIARIKAQGEAIARTLWKKG
jgi:hypothetical protein